MARWAFVGMAAVLAADSASAQNLWPNGAKTAAPAAGTATTEKRIVTMRTAGQPERRVEILRSEVLPDGTQFTELKDITTGAVYSIMGPPPGPDPFPVSKTPAATEAKTVQVADAGLPQARPRPNDPLLGVQSPAGQPSTAVAAAARVGQGNVALPKPNKPEVALVNGGMPTTQPIPKSAAAMPKQSAFAKAVFGEWPQAPQQAVPTARVNANTVAVQTTPARVNPPVRPAPTVVATAPRVETPTSPSMAAPSVYSPAPEKVVAAPVIEKPVEVASKPVVMPSLPAKSVEPAAAPVLTQVSATVEEETTSLLQQLANHSLPSGRIAAARALAELPTVSRAEVVQALVAGAENDSVGVVRGNCILVLNAMRYAHPEYVGMLRGWESSDEPAVRHAVRVALSNVR
jgi:hypothetical protein